MGIFKPQKLPNIINKDIYFLEHQLLGIYQPEHGSMPLQTFLFSRKITNYRKEANIRMAFKEKIFLSDYYNFILDFILLKEHCYSIQYFGYLYFIHNWVTKNKTFVLLIKLISCCKRPLAFCLIVNYTSASNSEKC